MLFKVIVLGLVEGLTEFIPVSSTGHLILVGNVLKFTDQFADSFSVIIQLGAILAVVILYRRIFLGLFNFKQPGFYGKREILLLFLTSVPALMFGALLHGWIKNYLFSVLTVSIALILGGVGMILAEKFSRKDKDTLDQITYKHALLIGLFQSISLFPGMSRAASTISGGLVLGYDRKIAAQYSFIAAVPIMFAACGYDALQNWEVLTAKGNLLLLGVGFAVSFVVALAAVKVFIEILKRWSLTSFAIYRIILGFLMIFLLLGGYVSIN
ncbi:MAG: hypothetical protein APR63_13375 [Desulfuromonas sp. SDB]|nr:MAG: hypothetical protein APR63_13375 [Desulfuromonas sp. SDB]